MTLPAVIAHRGAADAAPENTLAAFARAIELGANGIELDVHRTDDGAIVVHHDPVPPTAGSPPGLAGRPLATLSLAEVRRFRLPGGHPIPTLDETLALIGARATVYCELKGAGAVEAAAPLLARHPGPCAVHSFDHRAVARAAELAPDVPRGILLGSRLIDPIHAMRAAGATALWPNVEHVDQDLVVNVHEQGFSVIVWTVNDPFVVRRLTSWGVDALCTDDVPRTRAAAASA